MFCKNCGAKLDEGSKFCSGCGMAVNAEGKSPETVAENPQPNPYMNQQAATMENAYQQNTYQQNTYQQNAYGGTAYNAQAQAAMGRMNNPYSNQNYRQPDPMQQGSVKMRNFKINLGNKEMTSGIIWISIGGLQVLCSIFAFWYLIIVGIWNIVVGIMRITKKGELYQKSGIEIYNEYASRLTSLVVFLIVNILFGGIVGIAASIYDLVTRNYVIQNSYMLRNEE